MINIMKIYSEGIEVTLKRMMKDVEKLLSSTMKNIVNRILTKRPTMAYLLSNLIPTASFLITTTQT